MGSRGDQANSAIYARVREHFSLRRTALDIGAYIGEWTRLLKDDFEIVVAFEVRPENYSRLVKNAPAGCVFLPFGLADFSGETDFHIRGEYAQSPRAHPNEQNPLARYSVMTLDSLKFKNVDFIKLDVDGFEQQVIAGGIETILRWRPVMLVEIKLMSAVGRQAMLEALGYRAETMVSAIDEIWVPKHWPSEPGRDFFEVTAASSVPWWSTWVNADDHI